MLENLEISCFYHVFKPIFSFRRKLWGFQGLDCRHYLAALEGRFVHKIFKILKLIKYALMYNLTIFRADYGNLNTKALFALFKRRFQRHTTNLNLAIFD